ncbi:uncharacterized protein LOC110981092 [Acanthaster planci]|uniref:Uncharacterized protein LOC110981092 n=1 Tax=Acanthaster planci TaxID=133434 RepID=A0A8B7YL75_ACAPL|nr:uncharacterized protein LOC110981092 [Acanthaster planci]XP_022094009.1 uncharacterized protein LOC110981092 [Acanthaster planci]
MQMMAVVTLALLSLLLTGQSATGRATIPIVSPQDACYSTWDSGSHQFKWKTKNAEPNETLQVSCYGYLPNGTQVEVNNLEGLDSYRDCDSEKCELVTTLTMQYQYVTAKHISYCDSYVMKDGEVTRQGGEDSRVDILIQDDSLLSEDVKMIDPGQRGFEIRFNLKCGGSFKVFKISNSGERIPFNDCSEVSIENRGLEPCIRFMAGRRLMPELYFPAPSCHDVGPYLIIHQDSRNFKPQETTLNFWIKTNDASCSNEVPQTTESPTAGEGVENQTHFGGTAAPNSSDNMGYTVALAAVCVILGMVVFALVCFWLIKKRKRSVVRCCGNVPKNNDKDPETQVQMVPPVASVLISHHEGAQGVS